MAVKEFEQVMINNKKYMSFSSIAVLCIALIGCEDPEQQKVKYLAEGKNFFQAGEYDKAGLALKNVLQIDPENWEGHLLLGEVFNKLGKLDAAYKEYSLVVMKDDSNQLARLRLAQVLLFTHNIDRAEILIKSVLAAQPNNYEALLVSASVQAFHHDYVNALLTVDKAKLIRSDDPSVMMMEAVIYADSDRLDQAISLLTAAVEKYPDNTRVLSVLAELYIRNQQLAEAEAILHKIVAINPSEEEYYKNLAAFQVAGKHIDKAEATLREAVKNLPENDNAKLNLIDFLERYRGVNVAIAELSDIIDKDADNLDLQLKLAGLQMAKKDMTAAEQTLELVTKLDKSGPLGNRARNQLAAIYMATQRQDDAKVLNKEALEHNPKDSNALMMRGEFAKSENRLANALADFHAVLNLEPKNVNVLKMLAEIYIMINDPAAAKENLEKALGLAPNDEMVRLDLALLEFKEGSKSQARHQIEIYQNAHPDNIRAYDVLFRFAMQDKQWEQGLEIAKQVQKLMSREGLGWYMSGLCYQLTKKPELAIQDFQEALVKSPDADEPLAELIRIYRSLKQPGKAVEKLQQIISHHPNKPEPYIMLGNLLIEMEKPNEARAAFQTVRNMRPDWFASYLGMASLELMQKNESEAIKQLQNGIERSKDNLELVAELARIYYHQGQNKKLLSVYEAAYKAHPQSLLLVNSLAGALAEFSTAPEDFDRAAKIAEPLQIFNTPAFQETLAWIAYKQGDYSKAKDLLLKVVDQQAITTVGQYHLGMVFYKQKETGMATVYLQKALGSSVDFDGRQEANETLKRIQDNIF